MDLSGYLKGTPLERFHDPANKKVPGKFSDEKPTEIISEVIALKPKMYSIVTKKLLSKCKKAHNCTSSCSIGHSVVAKGIAKTAQRKIRHEDYRRVLSTQCTTITKSQTIRAYGNKIYSFVVQKRGLSGFDDKKFILDDGISTISYGHKQLFKN